MFSWFSALASDFDGSFGRDSSRQVAFVRSDLLLLSKDIRKQAPHLSRKLSVMAERLPERMSGREGLPAAKEIMEILWPLHQEILYYQNGFWDAIHPRIVLVSRQLFFDELYLQSVEAAFQAINERARAIHEARLDCRVFYEMSIMDLVRIECSRKKRTECGMLEQGEGELAEMHAALDCAQSYVIRELCFASRIMQYMDKTLETVKNEAEQSET